jgi:deoxycytidylate deaminase
MSSSLDDVVAAKDKRSACLSVQPDAAIARDCSIASRGCRDQLRCGFVVLHNHHIVIGLEVGNEFAERGLSHVKVHGFGHASISNVASMNTRQNDNIFGDSDDTELRVLNGT